MCKKFRDYLIGSKFIVLTDNNPLTYVCTSKLSVSQICWLSDLTLFDFNIKDLAGKSNQAADALSWQPSNPNSASESSDWEDEWETISYEMVCQILDFHLDSSKLLRGIKHKVQINIEDVDEANQSVGFQLISVVDTQLKEAKIFSSITPLSDYQKKMPSCQLSTSLY